MYSPLSAATTEQVGGAPRARKETGHPAFSIEKRRADTTASFFSKSLA